MLTLVMNKPKVIYLSILKLVNFLEIMQMRAIKVLINTPLQMFQQAKEDTEDIQLLMISDLSTMVK